MADLKPCPCCAGAATFDHDDQGWNWIECQACGLSTNSAVSHMDDCKPVLAERWNRRATEAEDTGKQGAVKFNEDAERHAFEDVIRGITDPNNHQDDLARDEHAHDDYARWPTQMAWEVWKASAAQPRKRVELTDAQAEAIALQAEAVILARNAAPASEPAQGKMYVCCYECSNCGHVGINDESDTEAACGYPCGWHGPSPVEDKCPGCEREGTMVSACPNCGNRYSVLAEVSLPVTVNAILATPSATVDVAASGEAVYQEQAYKSHVWNDVTKGLYDAGIRGEIGRKCKYRVLYTAPIGAAAADFDAWMANPYTKVLQKSIAEDYVPKTDAGVANGEALSPNTPVAWRWRDGTEDRWRFTRHAPDGLARTPKFIEPLCLAAAPTPTAPDDVARLDYLTSNGAWIAWGHDGETCRVFYRNEDGENQPIMGWNTPWFSTAREAIDAAIAASQSDGAEGV